MFKFKQIILIAILVLLSFHYDMVAQSNSPFDNLEFRCVGPTRGGRVTAVAGVPAISSTFYMGSTGGGVWKTTNYGHSWKNISDGFFASPSIGAIRVAPSDAKTIYVGTGSDGIRSNVIAGKGIYKSTDAGETWTHLGLEKTGQIGAVEIHPEDANTVFVAAIGNAFVTNPDRGIYRSKDGGENWEQILFVSDSTGAVDLEFAPGDPNIIYASLWRAERKPWTIISGSAVEGGIYKSIDGGDTWEKLENGLPTDGFFGKSDLAVSPADPNKLYALIEAEPGAGLYLSNDQGGSFELISNKKELLDRPFYYCNIDADPNDADRLYCSSTRAYRSIDGGKSWSRMFTPHGDNHDIWINPNDSDLFVQANDGGVNITRDGGKTWSTQNNQATAELYQVEVDNQFPYRLYAGQQDNSTIMLPSLPPYNSIADETSYWQAVGGCETGPVVPKPGNHNIVYANCKGRFGVYDKRTGQEKQYYVGASNMYGHNPKDLKFRFQRVAPIHVSPHDPDVVYHGSQYLHKTVDDGLTWEIISPDLTAFETDKQVISGSPITRDITGEEFYSTIYSIQESKIAAGMIWIGANDGPVHVTYDGGQNWADVTPTSLAPGGRIDCVEPSPHRAEKAYFTALRYQLGDDKPYIFKTEDRGESWKLITNGIPEDYPVRVLREDPNREGLLYAGTEYGMFVSFDDGENWQPFQQNLPITPVTDIKVHQQDLVLSTMGRSFWILDDLTALHQYDDTKKNPSTYLFKPRDAYRMRYSGSSAKSIPNYPGPSVIINYQLQSDANKGVKLEFLNDKNEIVRAFVSTENSFKEISDSEPSMATGFFVQGTSPKLKTTPGLHRFRWDMRHTAAWSKESSRRGGPMVAPGEYKVRLTVDDQIFTQNFYIDLDPRINSSGISMDDLIAQEELILKVRNLRSQAEQMAANVTSSLNNRRKKTKQELEQLNILNAALTTAEGRYMQPKLTAQLRYLYFMLDRADQRPGLDAFERYDELKKQLDELEKGYKSVIGGNNSDE